MADKSPELHIVDGPVGHQYHSVEPWKLAALLVRGIGNIAEWIIENDDLAMKPQGYRLTSWVETHESTDGYALLMSRPKPIQTKFGGYQIAANVFDVDLTADTIKPYPPIFISTADTQSVSAVEELVESYDLHDMMVAIKMVSKIRDAIKLGDYHSDINPNVSTALISHPRHLDLLAESFPAPTLSNE